MKLTIHQILLYPKDTSQLVRAVDFKPGCVNVITGTSARGKSAIARIIDYCLGSEKCAIPVGVIRETVAWYALLIEVGTGLMFIARREPEHKQSTDEYCFIERNDLAIPLRVEKNSNRDAFKARMDSLCGLPSLDLAAGQSSSGYNGRASFRDMAAFNFLPQHIVANPQTLFAKTDRTEHREKLRRIMPLVLGAVGSEYLRAEHEEAVIRAQLQRHQAELDRRKKAADTWRSQLLGYFATARELGLVPVEQSDPQGTSQVIEAFRKIIKDKHTIDHPSLHTGNTEKALSKLVGLTKQEREISSELGDARRQLRRIQSLSDSIVQYQNQLTEESNRVVGVGWFEQKLAHPSCPFCGGTNEHATRGLQLLREATKDIKGLATSAREAPELLAREEARLRVKVRASEEALQAVRKERWQLEATSREAARIRQRMSEIYRFVGRVEQAVSNVDESDDGSELANKVAVLRERLGELRQVLDPEAARQRMESALEQVSRLIQPFAEEMQLERSGDIIRLQPRELTLTFQSNDGREDFLWEVGSGENWMGYHIACLCALHAFFLKTQHNPVPTFLVVDQPSQVYFPARADAYDQAKRDVDESALHGDFLKARRIFEALASGVTRACQNLQVIVTEHADELTWGNISGVHQVENWRNDRWLIPQAWIQARET